MQELSRPELNAARPIDYLSWRPSMASPVGQPLSASGFPHAVPAHGSMIAVRPSFL